MTRWRGPADLAVALLALVAIAAVLIGGSIVLEWFDRLEAQLGWIGVRVVFWGSLALLGLALGWWRWPKKP